MTTDSFNTVHKPAMTPQQAKLSDSEASGFSMYREWAVGDESLAFLCYYEFCTLLLSGLPGLAGYGMRSIFYPRLFSKCAKRAGFGRGIVVRNPRRITLGAGILVDDYAALDVRGRDGEIEIGDRVSIGRFSTVVAKNGKISLDAGVNIGSYCRIATQSCVSLGESTLVAAYAYIGAGNHQRGDEQTPLIEREMEIKGGVTVGRRAWIGARATILDGVTVGEESIVGAHSFVVSDVPPRTMVAGAPAKVVKHF